MVRPMYGNLASASPVGDGDGEVGVFPALDQVGRLGSHSPSPSRTGAPSARNGLRPGLVWIRRVEVDADLVVRVVLHA